MLQINEVLMVLTGIEAKNKNREITNEFDAVHAGFIFRSTRSLGGCEYLFRQSPFVPQEALRRRKGCEYLF